MDKLINHNPPRIMFVDLNSCFATVEQQANPLLRNKPIVVAAYDSPGGCIVSPSIEAKAIGIKVGMTVRDARLIDKNVIAKLPDPDKYRDVQNKFNKIFADYTPKVTPKSIDESVLDFSNMPNLKRSLIDIGKEIKARFRLEIGEWMSCSIGIGTNRFLAKLASNLNKPKSLDLIDHHNLLDIYQKVSLTDLNGINTAFQARLNAFGIYTPLDFFRAEIQTLERQVFKSICGKYWYFRLRGWEIDSVEFDRKSFGQAYSLGKKTSDKGKLMAILMKLCEKMGRRLRADGYQARGIWLSLLYDDYSYWHKSVSFQTSVFTTQDLFKKAILVFNYQPKFGVIRKISVSCFNLSKNNNNQLKLWQDSQDKENEISKSLDKINDKYGEFSVIWATMMNTNNLAIDRISFGK